MPQPCSIIQSEYDDLSGVVNGPAVVSFGQHFTIPPSSGSVIRSPLQALVLGVLSSTICTTTTYTHPSLTITILEWYGKIKPIPAYPNSIIIFETS